MENLTPELELECLQFVVRLSNDDEREAFRKKLRKAMLDAADVNETIENVQRLLRKAKKKANRQLANTDTDMSKEKKKRRKEKKSKFVDLEAGVGKGSDEGSDDEEEEDAEDNSAGESSEESVESSSEGD